MDIIDHLLVEGFKAKNEFDPERALGFFLQAAELEKEDAYIRLEVARCHVELMDAAQAAEALARVESLADGDDEVFLELGRVWVSAGEMEQAMRAFSRVKPGSAEYLQASLEAFMLLERANRLDDASRLLEERKISKNRPEFQLMSALLDERQGEISRAERRLRRLWNGVPRSGLDLEVGYRLARLLDRKGRAPEALRILASCKQQEATAMPVDTVRGFTKARREQDLEALESGGANWFSDRCSPAESRSLLLLGHPRSGTSLMAKRLSDSLGVEWIDEKPAFEVTARELLGTAEPSGSLTDLLKKVGASRALEFEKAYRSKLSAPAGPFIDKNPGLSCSLVSLHRLLPRAAWLMMLRDPRDVALSCYFQRFGSTSLGVACLTLGGAFEAVAHTMRYWQEVKQHLASDQFIEVRYENLVGNIENQVAEVNARLAWSGSDDGEKGEFLNLTPSYEAIEKPAYQDSVKRWEKAGVDWAKLSPEANELAETLGYGPPS